MRRALVVGPIGDISIEQNITSFMLHYPPTIDASRFLITASAPFIISSMMLAALIRRLVWPTDSPAKGSSLRGRR